MSIQKSERELLLEHFDANTPVLVAYGTSPTPIWWRAAQLGDLMESLIPQHSHDQQNTDAKVGLVIAAPIGLNRPGRVIEVLKLGASSGSFVELALAAFARARAEVASDDTDAADERRHIELISQLVYRPMG